MQTRTVLHAYLATQQVSCLNTVRTFMNHVQAVVAPVLLYWKVARIAIATMNLDGQRVGLQAILTGPALGNRRQHLQQQLGAGRFLGSAGASFVHQTGTVHVQRQRAFAIRLLCQQHALDVGVFNDGYLGAGCVFAALCHGPALRAILGIFQAGVIASQAQHGGRHANANARFVHHVEHAFEAFVRLAH